MNKLDERIRQALSEEDARLAAALHEEPGVFELVSLSFKGKQAWMTWYMWVLGLVIFILGLYCLSRFFSASDLKTSLAWALGVIATLFMISLIKILSWQQLQKLEMLRELKRLELRLSLPRESARSEISSDE